MALTRTAAIVVGVVVAVVVCGLALGLGLGLGLRPHTHTPHDASSTLKPPATGKLSPGVTPTPRTKPALSQLATSPSIPDPSKSLPESAKALVQRARLQASQPAKTADFPIHAVFTWVNGDDEKWRDSKREVHRKLFGRPHVENPRDPMRAEGNRDELYYSVHCVTKFCPWLDRVWIVSARGHRPAWLNLGTRDGRKAASTVVNGVQVTVVHHDRVMDFSCVAYPTFNSNVIEAELPHIKQLAEHFIMFNDDFFVGRPMDREDFFTASGTPVVQLRDASGTIASLASMWGQHLRNMQAFCQALGLGVGLVPEHVAAPVRKSVLAAIVKATQDVGVCRLLPFRSNMDFPIWYVALNGAPRAPRPRPLDVRYFGSGPDFVRHMASASKLAPHLFCINQEFTPEARSVLDDLIHSK